LASTGIIESSSLHLGPEELPARPSTGHLLAIQTSTSVIRCVSDAVISMFKGRVWLPVQIFSTILAKEKENAVDNYQIRSP